MKSSKYIICFSAGSLILYSVLVLVFAPDFTFPNSPTQQMKLVYTAGRILLGVILFVFFIHLLLNRISKKMLLALGAVGVLVRILLAFSSPIMEDDFYRYLWDGAVTANFINPYEYSPESARTGESMDSSDAELLRNLSSEAGTVYERINHPQIRTIYPAVAQTVFAFSYVIKPWSVTVFKLIALFIDLITGYLLILLLRRLNLRVELSLIYWLNPLVIQEFFNGAHMDFIIFPFLLFSVLLLLKGKNSAAVIFLALAVGVKIWPVVFLPFYLQKKFKDWKTTVLLSLQFAGTVFILYLPVLVTKLDSSLGFIRYAGNWYNNDALFRLMTVAFRWFADTLGIANHCSHCNARFIIAAIYLLILMYLFIKFKPDVRSFIKTISLAVILIFLITPTQFPWYYTWLLPLIVVSPRISILLYVVFLPLYHWAQYWEGIVYIEHLPILILFILEVKGKIFKNLFDKRDLLELSESDVSKTYISG